MLHTGCMVHYKEISNIEGVERNKKIVKQICVTFKSLFVTSKVSKILYISIDGMKPLPQYVLTDKVMYCSGFFIF